MLQQDEVLKLAKQAQVHEELCGEYFIYGFAKLVALRYEKKIAGLENIICQRHWDVLQEREACAKLCDNIYEFGPEGEWCAHAIRTGEHLRGYNE